VTKLEDAAYYLLSNISNTINYHKLGKLIGMHENTIKDYLSYFERSYLSFQVAKFAYSVKEQMKSPRKVYFIDCGLRNAVSFRFSQDIGRLMENLVFIDLRRRGCSIYYWKNGNEVDFAIKQGLKITELIQVSYDIRDQGTRKREETALVKGMDFFGLDNGFIITDDYFGEVIVDSKKINYIPLWAWLLRI
jgi:predicted AAA+ superfamily ATPase